VEVRELNDAELAAQVFTLVELDFDEEHVGLLRGESSESRVEPVNKKHDVILIARTIIKINVPPAAVAPFRVEFYDKEGGRAGVTVRRAHDVP